ncbi:MAG: glycosyltransferase family 4 protein, partial [Chryseosolibacter sp.]
MNVLMFGWEFPPHISGGLGTACFGLTQSLIKQKVKVLFVVPRLFGDESTKNATLISAGDVTRDGKVKTRAGRTVKARRITAVSEKEYGQPAVVSKRSGLTYIEVPAGMSPYAVTTDQPSGRFSQLTHWNYPVNARERISVVPEQEQSINSQTINEDPDEADHDEFSGSYGPGLLDEVRRYGEIGAVIAGRYAFDVIHAHDWMTFTAGISAKQVSKKPLIVHVHSTEVDRAGEHINNEIFELEKRGFMEADHLITVSNWTKRIVVSRYKIPADKISVVHNGILPKEQIAGIEFPQIGS